MANPPAACLSCTFPLYFLCVSFGPLELLLWDSGGGHTVLQISHREAAERLMVPACIILLTAPLYGIAKRFEHLRRKALCKHKVFFISCLFGLVIKNERIENHQRNSLVDFIWNLYFQPLPLYIITVVFIFYQCNFKFQSFVQMVLNGMRSFLV